MVRFIGMDVHREFAQLAVVEDGLVRDEGRIGDRLVGQFRADPGLQVVLDVADRHALRIQADDHVRQAVQPSLTLAHQLGVEAAVAVPRGGQVDVADLGTQPFRAGPVAGIARPVPGPVMLLIGGCQRFCVSA